MIYLMVARNANGSTRTAFVHTEEQLPALQVMNAAEVVVEVDPDTTTTHLLAGHESKMVYIDEAEVVRWVDAGRPFSYRFITGR